MKTISQGLLIALLFFAASCGNSKKDNNATLNDKKAELAKLQQQKLSIEEKIKALEAAIAKSDTTAASTKVKLVAVTPVSISKFEHFIDLQAKVDAENISYISPSGMAGQVKAVYVQQGQAVKKGQLLLKLDDRIQQQGIVAARQQLGGIKAQLSLARSVYERQKNLWDKGIGTEVQLLNAKTNVEGLESQLRGATEQVQLAVVQANTSNVYSDVSGIADIVNIRVGETFTGMTAAGPQIKIVNNSNLKVVSSVPENYISRLKKGTPVVVAVNDLNKTYNTSISLISQSIDATMRGFIAEAKIPSDPQLKPNQTAVMKIKDYTTDNALVIPVNVLQADESGKYVYIMELLNGKNVARKHPVNIGEVYADKVEIKTGLKAGDQLVTEGYQSLYDGQLIGTLK